MRTLKLAGLALVLLLSAMWLPQAELGAQFGPQPRNFTPVRESDGSIFLNGADRWTVGFNSIAATLTEIRAVPAVATQQHYVKFLAIQTTTATSGTWALQSGTGVNCGTGTTAVFPISGTANRFNAPITSSPMLWVTFEIPIVLTAGHALCIIGVATNTVSGQVVGFTQ